MNLSAGYLTPPMHPPTPYDAVSIWLILLIAFTITLGAVGVVMPIQEKLPRKLKSVLIPISAAALTIGLVCGAVTVNSWRTIGNLHQLARDAYTSRVHVEQKQYAEWARINYGFIASKAGFTSSKKCLTTSTQCESATGLLNGRAASVTINWINSEQGEAQLFLTGQPLALEPK